MNCYEAHDLWRLHCCSRSDRRFVGGSAQSRFQNYRCADGTQFIVGFFQYDSRAHLQLDGKR